MKRPPIDPTIRDIRETMERIEEILQELNPRQREIALTFLVSLAQAFVDILEAKIDTVERGGRETHASTV